MIERIVSGAQTGVDRAALDVAMELGVATGGWVPLGRRAEDGRIPDRYAGLRETDSTSYRRRTRLNVRDSDATLIVTDGAPSGGTLLTAMAARAIARPLLVVRADELSPAKACAAVRDWLTETNPRVLNVAGPRASGSPDIGRYVSIVLRGALAVSPGDRE